MNKSFSCKNYRCCHKTDEKMANSSGKADQVTVILVLPNQE